MNSNNISGIFRRIPPVSTVFSLFSFIASIMIFDNQNLLRKLCFYRSCVKQVKELYRLFTNFFFMNTGDVFFSGFPYILYDISY